MPGFKACGFGSTCLGLLMMTWYGWVRCFCELYLFAWICYVCYNVFVLVCCGVFVVRRKFCGLWCCNTAFDLLVGLIITCLCF